MAVSVVVSASKIDLQGSGTITITEVEVAVANDTIMEESPANTFTIKGNRELEVSSGVTLTSEDGDTLVWDLSANKYPILDVARGGTLTLAQNTTIIGDTNATQQSYIYFYGTVNINGTSGNEVTFENYRSIYIYMYDTTAWDWDYVVLQNTTYASGYFIYFRPGDLGSYDGGGVAHDFNEVTIQDDGGEGYIYFMYGDYSAMSFTNWTIDGIEGCHIKYNSAIKLENWTFKNCDDYTRHYWNGFAGTYPHYTTSKTSNWWTQGYNQPLFIYDTCEFDAQDGGVWSMLTYSGGTYLVKSCTFKNATYGMAAYDSIILLYGTQTFDTITTDKSWSGGGTFLHVRAFDITVQDVDGTAIENACVSIRQKEDKEEWSFYTDANGQVKSVFGDSLYLVEKEETSEGVFTQWSDGTGNQIHEIIVSHPDYDTVKESYAMTQDRDITVTLRPQGTTIYDSTLYDAQIY